MEGGVSDWLSSEWKQYVFIDDIYWGFVSGFETH